MTWYDLAVGDPDDPDFHWDGGDYSGNTPHLLLDLGFIGMFGCVQAMTTLKAEYGGRQLDWGASGARLTRERILEFLRGFRTCDEVWRQQAIAKVMTLDAEKVYVLYAYES